MTFSLTKKFDNGVRIGTLITPHGMIETPFFMPVGTVGSVKAMAPWELKELGADIVLSNTYHLYLRPGEQLIKSLGGLHKFMGWDKPILTDSGGYQVFSLGDRGGKKNGSLVKITEEGVTFQSHLDGSKHLFTPEKVIDIQLDLGVDILMPLDVCPSGNATPKEIEKAVELTIKWAKRAKEHFDRAIFSNEKWKMKNGKLPTRPMLHGIVQGGLDPALRKYCAEELIKLDFDGYSVGGLAVDFETRDMWEIVKLMGEILPEDKQRYLMGVGTPDDIIHAVKLGMDMFDCVLPTRLARHASVYVRNSGVLLTENVDNHFELINLLNSQYRTDGDVIDENCGCDACNRGLTKAYIAHLLHSNEILGLRLATSHNLWQYLNLMKELKG
ncbi:MAG: tRNA guanosine(34) transglycosylase Tgt [Candidatus Berkelbacteria bacterium]